MRRDVPACAADREAVVRVVETKEGVDDARPGKGVVYFSRVAERASSSRLSKYVMRPEYQNTTIRGWSTTTKLLAVMDARAAG